MRREPGDDAVPYLAPGADTVGQEYGGAVSHDRIVDANRWGHERSSWKNVGARQLTPTKMSVPSTFTGKVFSGSSGGPSTTAPVRMSKNAW